MSATISRHSAPAAARSGAAYNVGKDSRPVPSQHRPLLYPGPGLPQPRSLFNASTSPSPSRHLSRAPASFHPRQTPLHRGCAGWASPVEAVV